MNVAVDPATDAGHGTVDLSDDDSGFTDDDSGRAIDVPVNGSVHDQGFCTHYFPTQHGTLADKCTISLVRIWRFGFLIPRERHGRKLSRKFLRCKGVAKLILKKRGG